MERLYTDLGMLVQFLGIGLLVRSSITYGTDLSKTLQRLFDESKRSERSANLKRLDTTLRTISRWNFFGYFFLALGIGLFVLGSVIL